MDGFITMAAYDTTDEIKAKADVVCSGKNDEQTFQKTVCRNYNRNFLRAKTCTDKKSSSRLYLGYKYGRYYRYNFGCRR